MEQLFHKFVVGGSSQQKLLTPAPANIGPGDQDAVEAMADGTRILERRGIDGAVDDTEEDRMQCNQKCSPVVFLGVCLFALVILLLSVSGKCDGAKTLTTTISTIRSVSCLFAMIFFYCDVYPGT